MALIDETSALVIVTGFLAVITGFYAWQTRRTVAALDKGTRQQILPVMRAGLKEMGPVALVLQISNVGSGAAQNVSVVYSARGLSGSERTWRTPLVKSGESHRFPIPTGKSSTEIPMEYFKGRKVILDIRYEFQTVFAEPVGYSESIDVSDWVEQYSSTVKLLDEPSLEKIHSELERLRRTMESIESRGLLVRTPKDVREEQEAFLKEFDKAKRKTGSKDEST